MSDILQFATRIAENAGQELYRHFRAGEPTARGTSKEVKSVFDTVADDLLVGEITAQYPDHSYVTEETGLVDNGGEYLWIIDPLDGTGNFENHNPFFAVSVALWKGNEPVLGVVEAPALGERFTAFSGEGAWRYDARTNKRQPLQVSEVTEPAHSYVVFCEGGETDKQRLKRIVNAVYGEVKEMRKLGAAALECVWVAAGRADAYIAPWIPVWDVAAGLVLMREANGAILRISGEHFSLSGVPSLKPIDLLVTNGYIKTSDTLLS